MLASPRYLYTISAMFTVQLGTLQPIHNIFVWSLPCMFEWIFHFLQDCINLKP